MSLGNLSLILIMNYLCLSYWQFLKIFAFGHFLLNVYPTSQGWILNKLVNMHDTGNQRWITNSWHLAVGDPKSTHSASGKAESTWTSSKPFCKLSKDRMEMPISIPKHESQSSYTLSSYEREGCNEPDPLSKEK